MLINGSTSAETQVLKRLTINWVQQQVESAHSTGGTWQPSEENICGIMKESWKRLIFASKIKEPEAESHLNSFVSFLVVSC